jgi:nucleotide-binding universal stress UspA family protein
MMGADITMKTILTFVGGGDRDPVVLQTALAAALPLSAHLDCLHCHVPTTQAVRYARLEFATGAALDGALARLETNTNVFSELAAEHVRAFCTKAAIGIGDGSAGGDGVTASFREDESNALERLTLHAGRGDLVVMGRLRQKQGLAPETLEHLARHCGRPILVAATTAPRKLTDTVMVCWSESGSAARAVTASTPLLAKAGRVVFVSAAKREAGLKDTLNGLAGQYSGNGVSTEVRVVPASGRGLQDALAETAAECGATLVVMGAYGRPRFRELLVGSRTEALLDAIDRPILLMH